MSEWKQITDHPDYMVSKDGDIYSLISRKKLKPQKQNGYHSVTLCDQGKQQAKLVHRIVAEEFLERDAERTFVNHKDGNRTNNSVENLEWCTQSENMKHAYATGLQRPIPAQIEYSLSRSHEAHKKPVRNIETGEIYDSVKECAETHGMCPSAVSQHVNGRIKHARFEYAEGGTYNAKQT